MSSIAELDELMRTGFYRAESRPQSRSTDSHAGPLDTPRKAKDRLRAASRRVHLDRIRQPEASTIGMALLKAVCTEESLEQVDSASAGILQAALLDLQARGYDVSQVLAVCKRLRKRWRQQEAKDSSHAG